MEMLSGVRSGGLYDLRTKQAWEVRAGVLATVVAMLCRAKFIVGSVKQLLEKEGGGAAWLQGLRQVPYQEASEALCTLPGVGPKVGQPCSTYKPPRKRHMHWKVAFLSQDDSYETARMGD